jgi:hypothetical protein
MTELDLQQLIEEVATPLVAGGAITVGAPVALGTARRWQQELGQVGAPSTEALDAARRRSAQRLVARVPELVLDATGLGLIVGIYDGLVLSHPDVGSARKARDRIQATALALIGSPPASTGHQLLSRHTVLAQLVELSRKDLHLRWWTGQAEFRGREAPSRLLRWKSVRRVRTFETRATWLELVGEPIAEALMVASPLTSVLAAGRGRPRFSWHGTEALLAERELLRAVAYHGAAVDQVSWRQGAATAWESLVAASAARPGREPAALVAQVSALLAYVGAWAADPGGELFAAIPALLEAAAPGWLAGLDAGLDRQPRESWRASATLAMSQLPLPRRSALVAALATALGRTASPDAAALAP